MNTNVENTTGRERTILLLYTVYTIAMVVAVFVFEWGSWVIPVIVAGLIVCIFMHIKQYRTYKVRAYITTVMMWMNYTIYLLNTTHSTSFTGTFSTMATLIILIAIYCIPNLVYIGTTVYTIILLYHLIFLHDIILNFNEVGMQNFIRIVSIYVIFFITYMLMKVQVESNAVMLENIEAVREAEQSKDDFMANMSHEIRTPINTVCGLSEMILREDLSDEVRNGVYDIQTAGRHLLSLVSDILDFSELSSGKMEIIPDTYNITSTVNDLLNMAVAKTEGKEIEIVVDCDPAIPRGLVGDEQKIRRAVMNVLDNAVKFTEEGGILVTFSFRKESYGGNLVITVQDTGIGTDEEMLETLYNRFSQIDTKRNRKISGMGLGLSITKVIVNRMGGFISVKSELNKGTTVQMVIPQQVNNEDPIMVLERPDESKTMLYLDIEKYHNSLVRDGYKAMVAHAGASMQIPYHHAKSLAECKRRMEREQFNFLFVAWKEYCEDKAYFEELSRHMNVVLMLEKNHKESIAGSRLLCVYKPVYSLTISSVLNGQYADYVGRNSGRGARFIAPEAKVLVVDDNIMNLKVVEGLMRPYKFKVTVAESGKEALEKIDNERFDVIFMDHMMPEMDGIEAFHRIRQKPGSYYREVPVVALTANAIGGAREMFLQEGFADYVSKPIEMSALERALNKFIPDEKKYMDYHDGDEFDDFCGSGYSNSSYSTKPTMETAPLSLDGIDTALGIHYSGDNLHDYIEIVRTYAKIGSTKKEDIKKCYSAGDWKNYTIHVHAVKSTSLNIGAVKLSEMAKALEEAGKSDDTVYITSHNNEMIKEYERVLSVISSDKTIFPDALKDEGKPDLSALSEISKDELKQKLETLLSNLDNFDEDASKECIADLSTYKYEEKALTEIISAIKDKLENFDFMGASEEAKNLINNK